MELTEANKLARLRWACRRGMLELDLILLAFLDAVFSKLAPEDKQRFELLLSSNDQELYQWLVKRETSDNPALEKIIQMIICHTQVC